MKPVRLLVCSMLALSSASVFAGNATPAPETVSGGDKVSVYRELDELRSENAILAEKLKNAELKAKIIASKDGGSASKSGASDSLLPPSPYGSFAQPSGMGAARQTLPMVQMISGSGGEVSARLTLPNGGQQMVRVGSVVPKFGTVKSISLNEVLLLDKSDYITLPFAPAQNVGTSPFSAGGAAPAGNPFASGSIGSPVRMGMP